MDLTSVESGVQLFSRVGQAKKSKLKNINQKLFPHGGPAANDVIEIIGDASTNLIVDFLMRCILPDGYGLDLEAILINASHHVSILKIASVIDAFLKSLKIKDRKNIIEKSLKNLIVLNCYSEQQLEMTFLNMENVINEHNRVNLVIIDDLRVHYWINFHKQPKLSMDYYAKTNLQLIHNTIKNLNIVLIFSRQDFKNSIDLNTDYKITCDNVNGQNRFVVEERGGKTINCVFYTIQGFIKYL